MSSASSLKKKLVLSSAFVASSFASYARRAYAACDPSPSPTYICSGANNSSQTISVNNANVSTAPGFSIVDSDPQTNAAIRIGGDGAINFTDVNGSVITSDTVYSSVGLSVSSYGDVGSDSGSVGIETNGTITGSYGIHAYNHGSGSLEITLSGEANGLGGQGIAAWTRGNGIGIVVAEGARSTGAANGIFARNNGSGNLAITVNGQAHGLAGAGIDAVSYGYDLMLTTGVGSVVRGFTAGIGATNYGVNNLSINVDGEVYGAFGPGIFAGNSPYGQDVIVTTGVNSRVDGGTYGIETINGGRGKLDVTVGGTVSGRDSYGILAKNLEDGTDLTISAKEGAVVLGTGSGIWGRNYGSGDATIIVDGDVEGQGGTGIYAATSNGALTITTGGESEVHGETVGISALNLGNGGVHITAGGVIAGSAYTGILVLNQGGGDTIVDVVSGALVRGTTEGIRVRSQENITITIADTAEVSNLVSLSEVAIAVETGTASVQNSGTIKGAIRLADDSTFDNDGEWVTAGGFSLFSGTNDRLYNRGTIIAAVDAGFEEYTQIFGLEAFDHSGLISVDDGGTGDVVSINGNFIGSDGSLHIDVELGDDYSATDMLQIDGVFSGRTTVYINNVGGAGAQTTEDGIEIASVGEGSSGQFVLGAPVIAGTFRYTLFEGAIDNPDNGAWYLRSSGYSPTVANYEIYPQVLLGLMEMPTLQQRVGDRYTTDGGEGSQSQLAVRLHRGDATGGAVWTRVEGAYNRFGGESTTGATYDLNRTLVQLGVDGQFLENGSGMLIGGINAQYRRANSDVSSDLGDGGATAEALGMGATLTWYGQEDFYFDGQASLTRLSGNLSAAETGTLVEDNKGFGYGLSVEAGRRISLGAGAGWSVTPQAQLRYGAVDFDNFEDRFGAQISSNRGESLVGRLGMALNYDATGPAGHSHFYAIANISNDFLDGTSVDVSGDEIAFDPSGLAGEFGIGGTFAWNGGKQTLYGELSLGTDLSKFADNYFGKASAGMRLAW